MTNALLDIQERLTKVVLEREQERLKSHQDAVCELAAAKAQEELRQSKAKEDQRLAKERRMRAELASKETDSERQRAQEEVLRLVEQEENRRQEDIAAVLQMKESIKRRMDDLEHAEEKAKRELRDVILQAEPQADSERIVPNPLERFFQPKE